MKQTDNIYLRMPIERVRQDAEHGVSLARQAWRLRDRDGAGRELGYVIEPEQQRAANDALQRLQKTK